MSDEEYVRSAWLEIEYGRKTRMGKPVKIWHRGRQYYAFTTWGCAAMFTRNRFEQIAEVEEEIDILILSDFTGPFAAMDRILDRERAALAELKRGMK